MIHKLYPSSTDALLKLPETGMGFQIIEANRPGSYIKNRYLVLNGELLIENDYSFDKYMHQIRVDGFKASLNRASLYDIKNISLYRQPSHTRLVTLGEVKRRKYKRYYGGKGATDNKEEYADGKEIFVRLSAYEDDKRIDFDNMCLRPGSYSTTFSDYRDCVDTEDNPVDRYALPNDEEIKWAFFILPAYKDILQRGLVQPAYGHDGGGIEAYFKNGTSPYTYEDKRKYGQ